MRYIPAALLLMSGFIGYAYADFHYPASAANPPLTIEQDPDVPANPNIYVTPQSIPAQPRGSFVTPNVPVIQNPPPVITPPPQPQNVQQPYQQIPPPQFQQQRMDLYNSSLFPVSSVIKVTLQEQEATEPDHCPPTDEKKSTTVTPSTDGDKETIPLETKDVGTPPTQAS